MSFMNILRFKRLPRPLSFEEIAAALEEHRLAGNLSDRDGYWVVCRCGERFPDGAGANGHVLLRRHAAEEICRLQRMEGHGGVPKEVR